MANGRTAASKHEQVFSTLMKEIRSGRWKVGERLPSEAELVRRFGHSRITVTRALRDLQHAGVIERRAGSGTYITPPAPPTGLSFGLLIPDLGETEIFEPLCQRMMQSPLAREHALLWGSVPGSDAAPAKQAWALCQHYIERGVSGVFFAPLEGTAHGGDTNTRIADALAAARIPVVLLDRPISPYPDAGRHDIVGIDNRRAGYVITEHLLRRGARRIVFAAQPQSASTVDEREAGYREALYRAHVPVHRTHAARLDPEDDGEVRELMRLGPDGIVCANDRTAGRLMHTLRRLGHRVPQDVRLVGIDDVEYARLLPVPLTTYRQPTRALGDAALAAMLQRVARRDLPPRDTRLHGELVVRESCGA